MYKDLSALHAKVFSFCTISCFIQDSLPAKASVTHFFCFCFSFLLKKKVIICTIAIYTNRGEVGFHACPAGLMMSLCRVRGVEGRGDVSNCARCKETVGSSRSSPRLTGTDCVGWGVGERALSHSWGHWCSPCLQHWRLVGPGALVCSHCHKHLCCMVWLEVQNDGSCMAYSWGKRTGFFL